MITDIRIPPWRWGKKPGGAAAFSPSDLSGLVAWPDSISSSLLNTVGPDVVATHGQGIRRWTDASGSGNDLDQAIGTDQPLAVKSVGLNGFGVTDFLSIAGTGDFDPGSSARDCWGACWCKRATGGATELLGGKDGSAGSRTWALIVNATTDAARISVSNDGTAVAEATTGDVGDSNWHLVVWYFDSSGQEVGISVDGAAYVTTATGFSQLFSSADVTSVGMFRNGTFPWSDSIDQWAFGVGAIPTIGEVASLYASGNGAKWSTLTGTWASASVVLESENGIGIDVSGNGNDMTMTGSVDPTAGAMERMTNWGVLFDGADDSLNAVFTLNQPFARVFVGRELRDHTNNVILAGDAANSYSQIVGVNGQIRLYAGAALTPVTAGRATFIRSVSRFNGATSAHQINAIAESTGNAGTQNPGGLTIGANNAQSGNWAAILVYSAPVYNVGLTNTDETTF